MQELRDRVAVVTGGASGIGLALCKAFLAEGMKVVVADVEEPALKAACEELAAAGGEVTGVRTDVSSLESVEALAEQTYATYGACHLLCNNAGVGAPNLNVWDTTPNDWKWVHGVNVQGVAFGVQAFVPRMLADGDEGFVMNTSSGDGGISAARRCSAFTRPRKAAVSILTECLARPARGAWTRQDASAGIFYPSGGLLKTGIWTTKRNRPAELAREKPTDPRTEMTWEEFMSGMKAAGIELPVQDLDELARFAVDGIKKGDFVIMIGREEMEAQLVDRAKKLARGECPIAAGLGH